MREEDRNGKLLGGECVSSQPRSTPLCSNGSSASCAEWSVDGEMIATGTSAHAVDIWSADCSFLRRLPFPTKAFNPWVYSVAWSPIRHQVIGCDNNYSICLWDADTGELLRHWRLDDECATTVSWLPNGRQFVVATTRGSITIQDIQLDEIELFRVIDRAFVDSDCAHDGSYFGTVVRGGPVGIWELSERNGRFLLWT